MLRQRPRWWRARSLGPSVLYSRCSKNEAPFRPRVANEGHPSDFKNSVKPRRCCLISTCISVDDLLRLATYTNLVRLVCNGALRFHAAPGTHVANIHKTLLKRRAFFCFHRLITAGTPNDRRRIHTILHNPSPTGSRCLLRPKQISHLRFYRGALACRTMRNSFRGDFEFRRAVKPR